MKLKKILAMGLAAAMVLSLPVAASADEGGVPGYLDITLGEDYTDLTATIKFLHCRTDREEDGTIAELVAKFKETYPNISVETEGVTDYA